MPGSNRYTHDWSRDELDTLRRCWNEGLPVIQIMRKLGAGITRSAIVGMADRIGLGNHPNAALPDKYRREAAYIPNGNPAPIASQRRGIDAAAHANALNSMEARDRQKLVKMPKVPFLERRLPGEPDSGRWV